MQKFNCKTCGAELYWDSEANCLKCEYCDSEYQIEDFEGVKAEEEKPQQAQEADSDARATDDSELGDLVVYQCSHCKAEVVTSKSTVATTCAFCGRAISMTNKLVDNFKPDVIIPFSVSEKEAKDIYKKYISSTYLTPKEFAKEAVVNKMKGIYVPYWLHSFQSNAKALVYCENLTSKRRGDDKIVEHHMYHVTVETEGQFKDIPTDALKHLDNALMDSLEPFDYGKLVDFNTAYMAGYYAEEYNESDTEASKRATKRATELMRSQTEKEAGIYAVKKIRNYNEDLSNVKAKYAMLPVWLLNVTYKEKEYLYAINGETGKIVGDLPVSGKKLWSAIGRALLASYVVVSILRFLMFWILW